MNINEEKLRAKVKQLFSESVPRYYDHTIVVVENMKKLIKDLDDPEEKTLLVTTAYLHDIGYTQPYGNDYAGNIEEQEIKIKLHSEEGGEIARRILEEIGAKEEMTRRVCYLVSVHHRKDIKDRHLKYLLEADEAPS